MGTPVPVAFWFDKLTAGAGYLCWQGSAAMSLLKPCHSCGAREPGKLCTLFWAWNRADHTRVAYRQQLCVTCYCTQVVTLEPEPYDGELRCPACHSASETDLDPVYLTQYVPGHGKFAWELPTCGACAVRVRNAAMLGAELLPDRTAEGLGAAGGPQTDATMVAWDALVLARGTSVQQP